MRILRVSEDVVPVGQFKARAKKWLARASQTGQPLVITQNGRPAGVLVSPREFDRIQERQRFLESIAAGLADAEAGKVIGTAELKKRLRAWRTERARG